MLHMQYAARAQYLQLAAQRTKKKSSGGEDCFLKPTQNTFFYKASLTNVT